MTITAPPWSEVRAEILSLYSSPLHPRATLFAIRRVFDLVEQLGVGSAEDLTPALVGRFVGRQGVAPRTIRGQLSYLSVIAKYCMERRWIAANPLAVRRTWVPVRVLGPPRHRHLSGDQVAQILSQATCEAAGGDWAARRLEALVHLLAYTGMRKSEALGLQVSDVDLVSRTLTLRPNSARLLKTRGSAAILPLSSCAIGVIARWLPATGGDWVFPTHSRQRPWLNGGPGSRPLDQVRSLGMRAGVPAATLTAFRHSWATRAEAVGVTRDHIRRMLRHTDGETSWVHYSFSDAEAIRPSAELMRF